MEFIGKSVEDLKAFAQEKKNVYQTADPFPNIYFDNFFIPEKLKEVLNEFPDLTKNADLKFNDPNQVKLASKGEYRFGDKTLHFMHFLNSQPFLEFLSELTGIENLIPDPFFDGGGCHQIQPGGMLKIHADFNKHPTTKLDRRLNVLVYMNEDWHEEYGGHFELWDTEMKGVRKKILALQPDGALLHHHQLLSRPSQPPDLPPGQDPQIPGALLLYQWKAGIRNY